MKCSRLLPLITVPMIFGFNSTISAEEPDQDAVRGAVSRSLPYIAERGQWWMDKKK